MPLYDDTDLIRSEDGGGGGGGGVAGWADSSLKLIQSQMRLKRAATTQPRRDLTRRSATTAATTATVTLAPVIDLKSKQRDTADQPLSVPPTLSHIGFASHKIVAPISVSSVPQFDSLDDCEFDIRNEYDPERPNDYERVCRDIRRDRDKVREKERRDRHERRSATSASSSSATAGDHSDEEADKEEEKKRTRSIGAAIAPPSSLQQNTNSPARVDSAAGGSIAAMIMAKYGYKEGQGLGKSGQGMSRALEVEKTSKRGGRIVHEKDKMAAGVSPATMAALGVTQPPTVDKTVMPPPASALMPPPPPPPPAFSGSVSGAQQVDTVSKPPTIAEILRNTTRVVLLRNMVGGGEVDEELESEVKEECQEKYGEVARVVIYEIPGSVDHEAVRIFVEFKRVENAIKALVDLNGRFFGGRQVCARFYDQDLFDKLDLSVHVP